MNKARDIVHATENIRIIFLKEELILNFEKQNNYIYGTDLFSNFYTLFL